MPNSSNRKVKKTAIRTASRKSTVSRRGRRRWGVDEIRRLRKLYPSLSNQGIARLLGRSLSSVVAQAFHLNLKKSTRRLARMGRENVACRWGRRKKRRS